MFAVAGLTQTRNPLIQGTKLSPETLFICMYQSLGHFLEYACIILDMGVLHFLATGHANLILDASFLNVVRSSGVFRGHAHFLWFAHGLRIMLAVGHAKVLHIVHGIRIILAVGHANCLSVVGRFRVMIAVVHVNFHGVVRGMCVILAIGRANFLRVIGGISVILAAGLATRLISGMEMEELEQDNSLAGARGPRRPVTHVDQK